MMNDQVYPVGSKPEKTEKSRSKLDLDIKDLIPSTYKLMIHASYALSWHPKVDILYSNCKLSAFQPQIVPFSPLELNSMVYII